MKTLESNAPTNHDHNAGGHRDAETQMYTLTLVVDDAEHSKFSDGKYYCLNLTNPQKNKQQVPCNMSFLTANLWRYVFVSLFEYFTPCLSFEGTVWRAWLTIPAVSA